ncbi:MAG: cytochrome-c peroxidase [Polyangiaceae bacterium]|nr:cytochrome-c peroxidase [Polyangiaceae bacterium]
MKRIVPTLATAVGVLMAVAVATGDAQGESPRAPHAAGGGDAPHGALAMDKQAALLTQLRGPAPAGGVPAGIDPTFFRSLIPADNAESEPRIALGRKLYFDPRLSSDGTVACATCHDMSRGGGDRRNTSEGIRDQLGKRNAPPIFNVVFFSSLFWDGRAATLEEQAKLPILNPIEMGEPDGKAAAAAIAGDPEYQKAFQAAYGRGVNYDDIGRALAAFVRTLVFLNSSFDRFALGDTRAINEDAKAGWALFNGKARCTGCHYINSSNPIGTDNRFHNIGVSARHQDFEMLARKGLEAVSKASTKEAIDKLALQTDLSELGRFVVTRNRSDIGAFKTPQLRNVGVTAPYMHDGSMATLWDVMDHYNKGGEANLYLDGGIEPLHLSETEVNQLVAFLFSLTDDRLYEQNRSELERQWQIASQRRPFRDDDLAARRVLPFERRVSGQR